MTAETPSVTPGSRRYLWSSFSNTEIKFAYVFGQTDTFKRIFQAIINPYQRIPNPSPGIVGGFLLQTSLLLQSPKIATK